jgi:hypothetical protein
VKITIDNDRVPRYLGNDSIFWKDGMKILMISLLVSAIGSGCSSSFQGVRTRAQSPPIEDAFKKITLAITTDGYELADLDAIKFHAETSWRVLREKEQSETDLKFRGERIESKLSLRCERRGSLYDVFVVPSLRYSTGGTTQEMVAEVRHPLWMKWQRVLSSLVQRESKEED